MTFVNGVVLSGHRQPRCEFGSDQSVLIRHEEQMSAGCVYRLIHTSGC